jgi:hypothetical protein
MTAVAVEQNAGLSPPDAVDRFIFALPPRRLRTVPHGGDSSPLPMENPVDVVGTMSH